MYLVDHGDEDSVVYSELIHEIAQSLHYLLPQLKIHDLKCSGKRVNDPRRVIREVHFVAQPSQRLDSQYARLTAKKLTIGTNTTVLDTHHECPIDLLE